MDECNTSPESATKEKGPKDYTFCLEELHGIRVPFIVRANKRKYAETDMLLKTLFQKHMTLFSRSIFYFACPTTYKTTRSDIKVLNEINRQHSYYYFSKTYRGYNTQSQFLLEKGQVEMLYDLLEVFYKMIVDKKIEEGAKCGYISIDGSPTPVPFVDTAQYGIVVPVFFFDMPQDSQMEFDLKDFWESTYLKLCCKLLSVNEALIADHRYIKVIILEKLKLLTPLKMEITFLDTLPAAVNIKTFSNRKESNLAANIEERNWIIKQTTQIVYRDKILANDSNGWLGDFRKIFAVEDRKNECPNAKNETVQQPDTMLLIKTEPRETQDASISMNLCHSQFPFQADSNLNRSGTSASLPNDILISQLGTGTTTLYNTPLQTNNLSLNIQSTTDGGNILPPTSVIPKDNINTSSTSQLNYIPYSFQILSDSSVLNDTLAAQQNSLKLVPAVNGYMLYPNNSSNSSTQINAAESCMNTNLIHSDTQNGSNIIGSTSQKTTLTIPNDLIIGQNNPATNKNKVQKLSKKQIKKRLKELRFTKPKEILPKLMIEVKILNEI